MSDGVLIALISAVAALLTAILVELIRTRRRTDTTVAELQPNHGSSMRDAVNRIEAEVAHVRTEQRTQGERLIVVETRLTDHLATGRGMTEPPPPRR
jgi:hypothetical protein